MSNVTKKLTSQKQTGLESNKFHITGKDFANYIFMQKDSSGNYKELERLTVLTIEGTTVFDKTNKSIGVVTQVYVEIESANFLGSAVILEITKTNNVTDLKR